MRNYAVGRLIFIKAYNSSYSVRVPPQSLISEAWFAVGTDAALMLTDWSQKREFKTVMRKSKEGNAEVVSEEAKRARMAAQKEAQVKRAHRYETPALTPGFRD